jgi:cell wall-associated NlpC family hydrolase
MQFAEERARVLAESVKWLGTPYLAHGRLRGAGADCAMSLLAWFADAGVMADFNPGPYAIQWALHHREEKYLAHVLEHAFEVAEEEVLPADMVLYRLGRAYGHGALIHEWPRKIIHAIESRGICYWHGYEGRLNRAPKRFFRLHRWRS